MTGSEPLRRATITEVAELAGVSHQTVSRYFRAPDGLKAATKERVSAAVRELNYRPNLVARSMRTRRSGRLAVIVPTLAFSPARMLSGAMRTAHDAGFAVDVLSLDGDAAERSDRLVELADSGQIEGIVSFAPLLPALDTAAAGIPVVTSGDFDDKMRSIGELADAEPVRTLVLGLADLGHRRFLHVTGSLDFASARARRDTYLEAIAGADLESVGVVEGDWSAESGRAAVLALDPESRPTAVIAANDVVASGVIRGAAERGWTVPGDLSVTGWDDQPLGRYLFPSLTTVDIDLELLGARTMRRLIVALRDDEVDIPTAPLTTVIWRESTGRVS